MTRRFQFNLKAMLVAVLVVAIAVWGYIQKNRSARFHSLAESAREKAEEYERAATLDGDIAAGKRGVLHINGTRVHLSLDDIEQYEISSAGCRVFATYWANLSAKYARAARTPWFSVEPDEPEPSNRDAFSGARWLAPEVDTVHGRRCEDEAAGKASSPAHTLLRALAEWQEFHESASVPQGEEE